MNKKKVVSYRPTWESQFIWIKKDKNSNSTFCEVCQVSFRIDNSGLSQVKTHGITKAHKNKTRLCYQERHLKEVLFQKTME